jgi:general L-amino acid transport system substrate-binding protein
MTMSPRSTRQGRLTLVAGLALAAGALAPGLAAAGTLEDVRQRGTLNCGVNTGLQGFGARDDKGQWAGFDVDLCKAVAAAVLNDASKVTYVPLSAGDRFAALSDRKIDLLSRNSTWTLEREAQLKLLFTGITFHDGQGFMVARKLNATSALELDKATVCVQQATTTELNLADFFRANSMTYEKRAFATSAEAVKAFDAGQCTALTMDQSALYAERLNLTKPADSMILPDVISKEPLGPVVRADDIAWFNVVKWVGFALVNAEELGIGTGTVAAAQASQRPEVRRFTGAEGDLGKALGLDKDWALRAVAAVGNYGEIYERNVGSGSKLGIPRGLNQLWSMGGILYAPPIR